MSRRQRRRPRVAPLVPIPAVLPEDETTAPTEPVYAKRRPGRPTLLTPQVEGMFMGMLLKGVYRNVASEACGLKPEVVEKWIARGRGRLKDRDPKPEYVRFVRMVEQAEAMARGQVESNVVRRSKFDHNAGLAWLRTRYPEQWPRSPGVVEEDAYGDRVERDRPPYVPSTAPPPMATTPQIAHQTNILYLNSDEWPELAHRLIGAQRVEQERLAKEVTEALDQQEEEASSGVPRHGRLDALRADAAADPAE